MINVGIVGATGYAGEELIDILLKHPDVRIRNVSAKIDKPQHVCELFPRFRNKIDLVCEAPQMKKILDSCDAVFLALPHTVSMEMAPRLLKAGKKVIDLSADYRLKNPKVYQKHYSVRHKDIKNIAKAVYGLPEIYRAKIRLARFIANPGCYPTASILAVAPLVALGLVELDSIIIDAKSGVTGAGRKLSEGLLFSEVNEDFKAYKVNEHQHAPEIDQELSKLAGKKLAVTFVPHLLPLNRGILATVYAKKFHKFQGSAERSGASPKGSAERSGASPKGTKHKILNLYKNFYKGEPFVRVREEGSFPRLKDVVRTNFCDIGVKEESDSVIVIAAIDNLLKGASGQAVHNLNIMYKLPETSGLL